MRVLTLLVVLSLIAGFSVFHWDTPGSSSLLKEERGNVAEPEFQKKALEKPPALSARRVAETLDSPNSTPEVKVNFDSAVDLYGLTFKAAHSSDTGLLVQGFMAAMTCMEVRQDRGRLENILLQSRAGGDQPNRAILESTELLLVRCRGFLNNDVSGINELRRVIAERVRGQGYYLMGVSPGKMDSSQFIKIVDSGDYVGFEMALVDIQDRLLSAQGIAQGSEEAGVFKAAYFLATCDVGRDCSGDSITYARMCALEGRCGGSLEKVLSSGIPPEFMQRIERYRAAIAKAFLEKDLSFFGVKGN